MQILILGHRSIGDVLQNMAVLKPLRDTFPSADITFLTSAIGQELLINNPYISRVIKIERAKTWMERVKRLCLILELRKIKYDLIVNLKRESQLPFLLRKKEVWNVRREDKTINAKRYTHAMDVYLNILKNHQISVDKQKLDLKIYILDNEKTFLNDLSGKKIIVIAPFANWHAKEWSIHRYRELASRLSHEAQIIFVGSKEDIPKMARIDFSLFSNWVGKLSLRELAALVEKADLVIGGDSGAFHLATNMGAKAFGIFGATTYQRVVPYFNPHHYVTCEKNLGCNPCMPAGNFMACGVYNRPTPCMEEISVDQVFHKVRDILTSGHVASL